MSLINYGYTEDLSNIPNHSNGPLDRYVFNSLKHNFILHEFKDVNNSIKYCDKHSHIENESLLLVGDIIMELYLNGNTLEIKSPCYIHIDSNIEHSINIINGTGSLVIIKSED